MPGIFGFVCKRPMDQPTRQSLLTGMQKRLMHYDYFEAESHLGDWFGVGHAGIPLASEKQLGQSADASVVAAFSGVIYGWKSDSPSSSTPKAQHLTALYRKDASRLPEKIDGSFNVAIFDNTSKELLICNDRFGHRQLYYFEDDSVFLFATEAKAFLAYDAFDRTVDLECAADMFNYGYPLGEKTLFAKAKILLGGHTLKVGNGRTALSTYWDYQYQEGNDRSLDEMVEEVDAIFRPLIKKRIGNAENIVIPLSGGLDSRFILAHTIMAGHNPWAITHGRSGCHDHKIAKDVVKTLNHDRYGFIEMNPYWLAEHAERFVYFSEGMNNTGPAVLMGVSTQYNLPPKSTAFLNGIFGGPTNFGSPYYKAADITETISHEEKLKNLRRSLWGDFVGDEHYALFTPEMGKRFAASYMPNIEADFQRSLKVSPLYCNQKDNFFIRNRIGRHMNLIDCNRFLWHDHFALADDLLVDFYLKIPAATKLSKSVMSAYFRSKLPDLARVTYQSTGVDLYHKPSPWKQKLRARINRYGYLAERLTQGHFKYYNPKNYSHFSQWYRADKRVRQFYEGVLLDQTTVQRGYFNRPTIEKFLNRMRKGGDSFFQLSDLVAFELFHRMFIDKK